MYQVGRKRAIFTMGLLLSICPSGPTKMPATMKMLMIGPSTAAAAPVVLRVHPINRPRDMLKHPPSTAYRTTNPTCPVNEFWMASTIMVRMIW